MWWGCQGVRDARSAQTGTASSPERQHAPAGQVQRVRQQQHAEPQDLEHDEAARVAQRGPCVPRGAERAARSHWATMPTRISTKPATIARKSRPSRPRGDAGRQHQHARDLHQHQQAVGHVVGVVGGGEPGEVHPRPPDREEHDREAEDGRPRMALHDAVVQPVGRLRDRDHEAEVEQQLERSGDPVRLVGVARRHRTMPASRWMRHARTSAASRATAASKAARIAVVSGPGVPAADRHVVDRDHGQHAAGRAGDEALVGRGQLVHPERRAARGERPPPRARATA